MKFRVLLAMIMFILFSKVYGQQFYVNSPTTYYGITINGSSYTWQQVPACLASPFSTAMSGKTMYTSGSLGQLYRSDLNNATLTNCSQIGKLSVSPSSLTIDGKGILYFASGNQLYKYDIKTGVETSLGMLPYASAGDLTFYKGDLYMAAQNGAIIQINLVNPSLSTVFMPVPSSYGSIYGMVTAVVNNKIKVYALGILSNSNTNLIELDFSTKTITGIVAVLPFIVYDAASPSETGNINQIKITNIGITQDCDSFNRGTMQITCAADTNQYTYQLNKGISNQTGTFTGLAPGTYNINITSTSGDSKDTTAIVPNYAPSVHPVSLTITNPGCGVISSVKLNPLQGVGYTVKYQNVSYPPNNVFTGLPPGDHHFTVYNQNGCVYDTLYAHINVSPCPDIVIDSTHIAKECNALNLGRVQIYTSPKNITLTYTLSNGASNTTGIFDNLIPGTYGLTITSPFANTKTATIIVPDYSPTSHPVTFTATNPACTVAGSISLSASQASSYTVEYQNTIYPSDHNFMGLAAGAYHFTVHDKNNCIIDTLYAKLVFIPCIDINIDRIGISKECNVINQGSLQINVSPQLTTLTYTLSNGPSNTTGLFNNLIPGTYTVKITSPYINEKDTTVVVPNYLLSKPTTTYTITPADCDAPGSITFDVTDNTGIVYKIGRNGRTYANNSKILTPLPGKYDFAILTDNGCVVDSMSVVITKVANCDPPIFPNTFTPNGDGKNDIFRPYARAVKNYELKIYNRNGMLIFTTTDPHAGWDGTYSNANMPVGTYFYVTTYITNDGKPAKQTGTIALIR